MMAGIRQVARRRALYMLREAARLCPDSAGDMLATDIRRGVRALDALPVRLAAAWGFLELKAHCFAQPATIETIVSRIRAILAGDPTAGVLAIPTDLSVGIQCVG